MLQPLRIAGRLILAVAALVALPAFYGAPGTQTPLPGWFVTDWVGASGVDRRYQIPGFPDAQRRATAMQDLQCKRTLAASSFAGERALRPDWWNACTSIPVFFGLQRLRPKEIHALYRLRDRSRWIQARAPAHLVRLTIARDDPSRPVVQAVRSASRVVRAEASRAELRQPRGTEGDPNIAMLHGVSRSSQDTPPVDPARSVRTPVSGLVHHEMVVPTPVLVAVGHAPRLAHSASLTPTSHKAVEVVGDPLPDWIDRVPLPVASPRRGPREQIRVVRRRRPLTSRASGLTRPRRQQQRRRQTRSTPARRRPRRATRQNAQPAQKPGRARWIGRALNNLQR